jgi:uncharacterized protein (DUF697 family)
MVKEKKAKPNIFEMFIDEAKKVNWNEINKMTGRQVSIGLVGSKANTTDMADWLYTLNYKLPFVKNPAVTENKKKSKKCLFVFNIEKDFDEKLLKSMTFCIVDENKQDIVRRLNIPTYLYLSDSENLADEILCDNEEYSYPLAHNFPAFRERVARREIQSTAMQNGGWAVGTAAPNIVPGPQQTITVPLEAISDFTILTTNEIKMLFSLQGILGYKANPVKAVSEYVIIVGLAKLAQTVATNTIGKIPAGAGVAAKGAVAFAFTMAIGEALFFYILTGKKVGKNFFEKAIPEFLAQGRKVFGKKEKKLIKKKANA